MFFSERCMTETMQWLYTASIIYECCILPRARPAGCRAVAHPMTPTAEPLRGSPFGLEMGNVTVEALRSDPAARAAVRAAFRRSNGLLLLQFDPAAFTGAAMVEVAAVLGRVEAAPADGSYERCLPDAPEVHEFAKVPSSRVFEARHRELGAAAAGSSAVSSSSSVSSSYQPFDPASGEPAWHTDQSFRSPSPLASVMYCTSTPSSGGDTLFASTTLAFAALSSEAQQRYENVSFAPF